MVREIGDRIVKVVPLDETLTLPMGGDKTDPPRPQSPASTRLWQRRHAVAP